MTKSVCSTPGIVHINFVVLKAAYFFPPNQRMVTQTGDNDKDPVNLEMLFICSTKFS